jgi:prepilin-type N-terminal cleavage/methylation domain-containing protein
MNRRGLTLLEMLIAVAIVSVVMVLAISVVNTGVLLARRGEQTVMSNEAARTGMEYLVRDLHLAGNGAPGGIWVADPTGPKNIRPIFTEPGANNGSDALWLVVPRAAMMSANCATPNSAVVLTTSSAAGNLNVNCNGTAPDVALAKTDTLMVTNFTTAALIDGLDFPTSTSITYRQSGTVSSAPEKGGFQRGDYAFPVDLVRYSIQINAMTQRPELLREVGVLSGNPAAAPFVVPCPSTAPAGSCVPGPTMRFPDVEDLQVAFGFGLQPNLTFQSRHEALSCLGPGCLPVQPQSVRVSLVATTPRSVLDTNGKIMPFKAAAVEDNAPTTPVDGFRRSVYRRRVELTNMNMVNM